MKILTMIINFVLKTKMLLFLAQNHLSISVLTLHVDKFFQTIQPVHSEVCEETYQWELLALDKMGDLSHDWSVDDINYRSQGNCHIFVVSTLTQ